MALVSITEAIKLSGVSRPTFYRKHIGDKAQKGNRVSVQDVNGRRMIDTSELLRVFKVLHGHNTETVSNETPVHSETKNGQLETTAKSTIGNNKPDHSAETELLRQQLREAKENQRRLKESEQRLKDEFLDRESWYRQQIEKQDDKIKLLEHHHLEQLTSSKWWQLWK